MLSLLKKINRGIHSVENAFLVLLVLSMLAMSITQIVLRNFADSGLVWADALLRILVLWLALTGGMVATRDGGHININIIGHYLRGGPKIFVTFLTLSLSGILCIIMAWHSWQFVLLEKEDNMIAFLTYPAWWFEIAIPIAFAVMAIRFIFGSIIYLVTGGRDDHLESLKNEDISPRQHENSKDNSNKGENAQ